MEKRTTCALAMAAAAMLCAAPCPAPMIGDFPGTEALMLDADAIVIAEVGERCLPEADRRKLERPSDWMYLVEWPAVGGIPLQYECRIVRTLKGDLVEGPALLALECMPVPKGFECPLWTEFAPPAHAARGPWGLHLIFLQGEPPLMSMPCFGATIPVPDGFVPEDVDGVDLDEALHRIIGDVDEPTTLRSSWLRASHQGQSVSSTAGRTYNPHECFRPSVAIIDIKSRTVPPGERRIAECARSQWPACWPPFDLSEGWIWSEEDQP